MSQEHRSKQRKKAFKKMAKIDKKSEKSMQKLEQEPPESPSSQPTDSSELIKNSQAEQTALVRKEPERTSVVLQEKANTSIERVAPPKQSMITPQASSGDEEQTIALLQAENSHLKTPVSTEQSDTSDDLQFGMEFKAVEKVSGLFERAHNGIRIALGSKMAIISGAVGSIMGVLLCFILLINPLSTIEFNIRSFQRVQKPTELSIQLKKTYRAIRKLSKSKRSVETLEKISSPRIAKEFAALKKLAQNANDWDLLSKMDPSHNFQQIFIALRTHIFSSPPHYDSYLSYLADNVVQPRSRNLDLFVILLRSLLVGLLMLFCVRILIEEFQPVEHKS
jgi:hypothetical protein